MKLKEIRIYFIALFVIFICGFLFLFYFGKVNAFLILNATRAAWADAFFISYTNFGDSLWLSSLALLICFRRVPAWTVVGLIALLLSGLTVVLFKNFVFDDKLRPLGLLGENNVYHFPGITEVFRSFPSGHSTSIGAIGPLGAFTIPRRYPYFQILLAFCVGLVGFSRIYMGAHFLEDVLAGLAIGTFSFIFVELLFISKLEGYFETASAHKMTIFQRMAVAIGSVGLLIGLYLRYFSSHKF